MKLSMRESLRARRRRSDRGAIAVLSALLAVVFLLLAAFAVDIASQVNNKHFLQNQLDAAVTGAAVFVDQTYDSANGKLPLEAAVNEAVARFNDNAQRFGSSREWDVSLFSHLTFWCVAKEDADQSGQQASLESLRKNCNPDRSFGDPGTGGTVDNPTYGIGSYQNLQRPAMTVGGASVAVDRQSMSCAVLNGTSLCAVPCAMTATASGDWNSDHTAVNWSPGSWDAGTGGIRLPDGTLNGPITCNAVQLSDTRLVNFQFSGAGKALGDEDTVTKGGVGALSVACKGWCGLEPDDAVEINYVPDSTSSTGYSIQCSEDGVVLPQCPQLFNAQDIVLVADRTYSMVSASGGTAQLRAGVSGLLANMIPSRQYLAFGAIGKSTTSNGCPTAVATNVSTGGGTWIPTNFSKTYQASGDTVATAVTCMKDVSSSQASSNGGTTLAAPLKAGAQKLLNADGGIHTAQRIADGNIQKVFILETDGTPQDTNTTVNTSAALSLTGTTMPASNLDDHTSSTKTTYRWYCSINAANNQWAENTSSTSAPSGWCGTTQTCTTGTLSTSPSGCYSSSTPTSYSCPSASGTRYYTPNSTWTVGCYQRQNTSGGGSCSTGWTKYKPSGGGTSYCYKLDPDVDPVGTCSSGYTWQPINGTLGCWKKLSNSPTTVSAAQGGWKTTVTTNTYYGGQVGCQQLQNVAAQARDGGISIITVAYNLDSNDMCSKANGGNDSNGNGDVTITKNTTGASGNATTCVTGQNTPYPQYNLSTCTYQGSLTITVNTNQNDSTRPDQKILDVLSGITTPNPTLTDNVSNSCSTAAEAEAENNDGDSFFCLENNAPSNEVTEALIRSLVSVSPPDIVKLMTKP